ncbi:MAG: hypothetical protein U0165_06815 [Polyangiaceae bacterium]
MAPLVNHHNPDEASRCDRLVLIDEGKRLAFGISPGALCKRHGSCRRHAQVEDNMGHSAMTDELTRASEMKLGCSARIMFEKKERTSSCRKSSGYTGKSKSISVHPLILAKRVRQAHREVSMNSSRSAMWMRTVQALWWRDIIRFLRQRSRVMGALANRTSVLGRDWYDLSDSFKMSGADAVDAALFLSGCGY